MYTNQDIREYYNRDSNQTRYSQAIESPGLWAAEKYVFAKYVNIHDRILDLGCGAGRTTINLYKLGYTNISGLDIAEKLIELASKYAKSNKLKIDFVVGDATKLDFPPASFDVAFFSYNGIMCIPQQVNREKVLANVQSVLKPGGLFIFTTIDREAAGAYRQFWLQEKQRWLVNKPDPNLYEYGDLIVTDITGEPSFLHFYSRHEVATMLKKHSFKILECRSRSAIAAEPKEVTDFSADTVFWIAKK